MTTPITLPYRGAAQAAAEDITHRAYILGLLAANISQAEVDALIAAGFAPYVTKAYVDTQDGLNATKAFIDAGDATRLKLAQKEVNNGIAALGPSGRVAVSHVNLASTQRFPKPFISPTAYQAAPVSATGTEVLLYPPVTVADPGFPYKLLVTGLVDATTSIDGEFPIIRVRQGSATGQLVATGAGCAQTYTGGVLTEFTTVGGQPLYGAALGGHPGRRLPGWGWCGMWGYFGGRYRRGQGCGGHGHPRPRHRHPGGHQRPHRDGRRRRYGGGDWCSRWGRGARRPRRARAGPVSVGAGGVHGGSGSGLGGGPGTITFNGHNYVGGAEAGVAVPGNPPGGGGGRRRAGFPFISPGGPGGAGAEGAAWILAYPSPNVPYGPVPIMPSAHNAQAPITGATTLHVMLARSGAAATVTASTLRPKLWIVPIPA